MNPAGPLSPKSNDQYKPLEKKVPNVSLPAGDPTSLQETDKAAQSMVKQINETKVVHTLDNYDYDPNFKFTLVDQGKVHVYDARELYDSICTSGLPCDWEKPPIKLSEKQLEKIESLVQRNDPKFQKVLALAAKNLGDPKKLKESDKLFLGKAYMKLKKAKSEDQKNIALTEFLQELREPQNGRAKTYLENNPIKGLFSISGYFELMETNPEKCGSDFFKPLEKFLSVFQPKSSLDTIQE